MMTIPQDNETRKCFLDAIAELTQCNHQFFIERSISPLEHGNRRGVALAKALRFMALEHGVTLKEPLAIDSRGEFSIVVSQPTPADYGKYGDAFAQWLNKHQPRCGMMPGSILSESSNWCKMNHFEVEKMVNLYYQKENNS